MRGGGALSIVVGRSAFLCSSYTEGGRIIVILVFSRFTEIQRKVKRMSGGGKMRIGKAVGGRKIEIFQVVENGNGLSDKKAREKQG